MEQQKTRHPQLKTFSWILGALLGVVFFGYMWQSTTLTCWRTGSLEPVSCTSEAKAFWLIPVGSKDFQNVQGAQVMESIDYEGDASYRVELLTEQGAEPLTSIFSDGASAKFKLVENINVFVQNREETALVASEPGNVNGETIFWILLPFIVLILSAIWDVAKSWLQPSQRRSGI